MNILIVKTSSMGDVIHNLPVLDDILQHYPNAVIDWVVEDSFAEILSLHPKVNRIITIALRRWKKKPFSKQTKNEISESIAALKKQPYDMIIDTQGLLKSVLVASLAHGTRHGRDWQSNREKIASLFYQHKHHVPYAQHTVGRNRELTALSLGYPNPTTAPEYGLPSLTLADEVDPNLALPAHYVLCLHATSRDSKLWPVESWVAFGRHLNYIGLALVLPWASSIEFERASHIANQLDNAVVLPSLGLKQLSYICAKAKAAVGVDTGLVHLAVAVKTPSIAIYTDTHPTLNGAYAANGATAINLGGVDNTPSIAEVIETFESLNVV